MDVAEQLMIWLQLLTVHHRYLIGTRSAHCLTNWKVIFRLHLCNYPHAKGMRRWRGG